MCPEACHGGRIVFPSQPVVFVFNSLLLCYHCSDASLARLRMCHPPVLRKPLPEFTYYFEGEQPKPMERCAATMSSLSRAVCAKWHGAWLFGITFHECIGIRDRFWEV